MVMWACEAKPQVTAICANSICVSVASRRTARTFADGIACRDPQAAPLAIICAGAARIVQLSEDEIAEAIRIYFTDTHNVAEGAGAAALAGLIRERHRYAGKRAAAILCGANIDASMLAEVLAGRTPQVLVTC